METTSKCAVPSCKSIGRLTKVRIRFPDDYMTQQLWWQALEVEHKEFTKEEYFLCTKHFNLEEDLVKFDLDYYRKNMKSKSVMWLRVEQNVIPFRFIPLPPSSRQAKLRIVKHCMVRTCGNNSRNAPDKLFLHVPRNHERRDKWFRATECKYFRHCCEDHFDLESDMENYNYFRMMGTRIRLKKDVVPHIFKPTATDFEYAECGRAEEKNDASNLPEDSALIHTTRFVKAESVLPTTATQVVSADHADNMLFKPEPNWDLNLMEYADIDDKTMNTDLQSENYSLLTSPPCDVKSELPSDDEQVDDLQDKTSSDFVNSSVSHIKNEIFLDEFIEDVNDQLTSNSSQFKNNTVSMNKKSRALSAIKAQLRQNPKVTVHTVAGPGEIELKLPRGTRLVENSMERYKTRTNIDNTFKSNNACNSTALSAFQAEPTNQNQIATSQSIIGLMIGPVVLPSPDGIADRDNSQDECKTLQDDTSAYRNSNVDSIKSSKSCTTLSAIKAQLRKQNPKVIIHPVVGPCKVALVLPPASS